MEGWTATLYTCEALTPLREEDEDDSLTPRQLNEEEQWVMADRRGMTSLVVALELTRVLGEVMHSHLSGWRPRHCMEFLNALDLCHQHARGFNGDIGMRNRLRERGFMKFPSDPRRLPHLLEQEIRSVTHMAFFSIRLFAEESPEDPLASDMMLLAIEWMERSTVHICERFMELDELMAASKAEVQTAGGFYFMKEQRDSYRQPVLVCLQGLETLSQTQFRSNVAWLVPLLTSLVSSDDSEIRAMVQSLQMSFVNPLVITAASMLPPDVENFNSE